MRAMTQGDVDAVFCIESAVQAYPWVRGNFVDALNNGYICRVDEAEDGEIRGYAILMPAVDAAELLTIGVAAAQQRKGFGRAILSEMLNLARATQVRHVFLEVLSTNAAAIALYRSAGFCQVGVRQDYYKNAKGSGDALVMACELTVEPNG